MIILAKNAGFCPGVKNAIDKVVELANKHKKVIYTLGPLIHNKQVIEILEAKKIFAIEDVSEIKNKNAILVIRAHGIPPLLEEKIKKLDIEVIDATCPLVKNVHKIIQKYAEMGYSTVIVGDKDHAEVQGLVGYAKDKSFVVSGPQEAEHLPKLEKVNIVAQTTQEEEIFLKTVEVVRNKTKDLIISNTICNPTKQRQRETIEMSKNADFIIVVGSKNSANTKRLFQICSSLAKKTVHIEKGSELTPEMFNNSKTIFITAGASTPNWMIEEVFKRTKELSGQHKSPFLKKLLVVWEFVVASCIYTSISAVSLAYVCMKLQSGFISQAVLFVTGFFVMSLHLINRAEEKGSIQADKLKEILFIKFKSKIKFVGTFAGVCALGTSIFLGLEIFFMTMLLWLMGMMYPQKLPFGMKKIANFPASKDIVTALGWGFVCAYVPGFLNNTLLTKETHLVIIFAVLLVFIRAVLFDIVYVHNDVIVGKENFYKAVGPKTTYLTIFLIFLLVETILVHLMNIGWKRKFINSTFLGLFYYLILILVFYLGKIPKRILAETLIDFQFILLAII